MAVPYQGNTGVYYNQTNTKKKTEIPTMNIRDYVHMFGVPSSAASKGNASAGNVSGMGGASGYTGGSKKVSKPKANPYQGALDALEAQGAAKAERPAAWDGGGITFQEPVKPGEYQSKYGSQIDALLDQVMNSKFHYDLNADPVYQQYKAQYMTLGNQAMRDTMGNAAALTGGYGNSYASTAGNQAYQQYLGQLNNAIPQLYQNAYSAYQGRQNNLMNQVGALQGQESALYGQYMDKMNQYNQDRAYAYNKYTQDRDFAYGEYLDAMNQYNQDRNYNAQAYDAEWEKIWKKYQNAR